MFSFFSLNCEQLISLSFMSAYLILGEYVIDQSTIVSLLFIDAFDEIEVRVDHIAGTVHGDHSEGGEKKCEHGKVGRPLRAVGQRGAEQRRHQAG